MSDHPALDANAIDAELKRLSGWELKEGWIRKTYQTPGWAHTLMAVNTIGLIADAAYHHPDLIVGYAQVTVKLQTHKVKGITALDFALAKRIDEVVLWQPDETSPLDGFPKKWIH